MTDNMVGHPIVSNTFLTDIRDEARELSVTQFSSSETELKESIESSLNVMVTKQVEDCVSEN